MQIAQILIRAAQFIFILLVTALIGNVLAGKTHSNAPTNYAMFTAAFCWLVWFFGMAAAFVEAIAIPVVLLILDGLATIFTFIAGVVLAAKLGGAHSCNNRAYLDSKAIQVDNGSTSKHCRELQASCAFFWFLFVCFIGSMIVTTVKGGPIGGGLGGRRSGGGAPAMSQVR